MLKSIRGMKCVRDFSLLVLFKTSLAPVSIQRVTVDCRKYVVLYARYPLLLASFKENLHVSTTFCKTPQYKL
jgi:hypothetical protein